MRIASLLPSATEIAFALGLGDQVVAVSHECDYPPEAAKRPVLTKSTIHRKIHASHEVDEEVAKRGGDIYEIDEKLLESLKPDLILTQEHCAVCAVSYTKVKEAARVLDADTRIVSLEPSNLEDIVDNIRLVGTIAGRTAQTEKLTSQRSEEHTSELQSQSNLVCRLLLEKKKKLGVTTRERGQGLHQLLRHFQDEEDVYGADLCLVLRAGSMPALLSV